MTIRNKGFDRHSTPLTFFPIIQLCSKWLCDSAFKVGLALDIAYEEDTIIITKSELQRFDVK